MKLRRLLVVVSANSGVGWGVIVVLLLDSRQRELFGGGFVFAPVIGVLAGIVAAWSKDVDVFTMAFVSLVSLYLTAALFGFGAGIVLQLLYPQPPVNVLTTALLVPYGMTIGGFVLWMWPLAYLNHRFVARFA
jgi:hypothetical protein